MNHDEPADRRPFLKTPIGIALIGFLIVGAFLLVAEHRAHIFTGNWFLWLLPLGCVVMHLFHGHGGHGGHGGGSKGHDHSGRQSNDDKGTGL